MKLAWMTDLHLDQVEKAERDKFLESVRTERYDAAVVTGDISNSSCLGQNLLALSQACAPRQLFFVLGNHDLGKRQDETEESVVVFCRRQRNLRPVWRQEVIPLTAQACLVGHHGGTNSDQQCLQATAHFRKVLPQALSRFQRVWLLTHAPPFIQVARFSGRPVSRSRREYFVNRPAGRTIAAIARQFPGKRVSVLCGHTHAAATAMISSTVDARAGASRLGFPTIQGIIDIS